MVCLDFSCEGNVTAWWSNSSFLQPTKSESNQIFPQIKQMLPQWKWLTGGDSLTLRFNRHTVYWNEGTCVYRCVYVSWGWGNQGRHVSSEGCCLLWESMLAGKENTHEIGMRKYWWTSHREREKGRNQMDQGDFNKSISFIQVYTEFLLGISA